MPSRDSSAELLRRIADAMGVGIEIFTEEGAVHVRHATREEEAALVDRLMQAFDALPDAEARRHAVTMIEALAAFMTSKGRTGSGTA